MKIQQHDDMVVDATAISAGLRQASARGSGVARGEGGARGWGIKSLLSPTIYRGARGGAGPSRWNLLGGRRPRGGFPPPQGT